MDAIAYRDARAEDADALGALHVAAWHETYAGLLPQPMLDGLSIAERSAAWRAVIENPAAYGGTRLFLAASAGRLAGFAASSDQRDVALAGEGFDGEFGAVYVLRDFQGRGVGRALMALMAGDLLDRGRTAGSLWVLRENLPARAFYERLGGRGCGEKAEERPGIVLHEVAYGWSDLRVLIDQGPSASAPPRLP